jgi:hypothetical protein
VHTQFHKALAYHIILRYSFIKTACGENHNFTAGFTARLPSSNQARLAGKSTIDFAKFPINSSIHSKCSSATFDCRIAGGIPN